MVRRRLIVGRLLRGTIALLATWLIAAYVILPALWRHYEHQPALADAPKVTTTAQGIPGDPLNVGLLGLERDVVGSMLEAGWHPADPITFRSSLGIARSVLLDRPYVDAPVSNLFLFGRRQDLAFERPAGRSASHRHHVRFWRSAELGQGELPLWIGAVTYDRSVGLSHRTGQVTHHIGPDVDAERDALIAGLVHHGRVARLYQVTGVGATLNGRNGGGDWYYTDGELTIAFLAPLGSPVPKPDRLANPAAVQLKAQLWTAIRPLLQSTPP